MTNSWREERLYILNMVDSLQAEVRRLSEEAAAGRAKMEEKADREGQKARQDLRAAHDKIRLMDNSVAALEKDKIILIMKNWLMRMVLGAIGAGVFELAKMWFRAARP